MEHWTQRKLRAAGFVYGTELFDNLKRALAWVDPNNSQSFDNWDIEIFMIDKKDYEEGCVCGHTIRYEHRIRHKEIGDTMEIGSHCIDRFSDEIKRKRMAMSRHILNLDCTYCKKCERKIPQKTIDKFPDEEILYHKSCWKKHQKEVYDNEAVVCMWCEEKPARKDLATHTETHADEIALHNAENRMMKWGKHNNRSLCYIARFDGKYLKWIANNAYTDDLRNDAMIVLKKKY